MSFGCDLIGRAHRVPTREARQRMRITDVKTNVVEAPAGPSYRWRKGIPGSSPAGTRAVIRVITDAGVEGVAHARRGSIVAEVVARRLRDELVGQDPLQREYLWHRIWEVDRIEELPIYALGVVDVALWDLAGKAAGLPVHQLLGGFRTSIPAYASTVTFESVEEYLDVADQCLELGYPAIKLHAWGDARADAQLCAAAARARGRRHSPDVRRVGRLRPYRRALSRPRTRRGGVPLVRGADAGVQHHRLPRPRREGTTFRSWSPRPPTAPT